MISKAGENPTVKLVPAPPLPRLSSNNKDDGKFTRPDLLSWNTNKIQAPLANRSIQNACYGIYSQQTII
jgi:hypothetical protein